MIVNIKKSFDSDLDRIQNLELLKKVLDNIKKI
jgi:hypothetical protein